jgi:hypothetical protein
MGFKLFHGCNHISSFQMFLIFGAGLEDLNPSPWAMWTTVVSLSCYAPSLLVLVALKHKKNR